MTVYLRLGMGLGNQMFQYAAGRALAERTGRELVLDLSMFGGEGSFGGWTPRRYGLRETFGIEHRIATSVEMAGFSFSQPVRRAWTKTVYSVPALARRLPPLTSGLPYEQPALVTATYRAYERLRPSHRRSTYFEPHFHHDPHFFDATADPVCLMGAWQSWRYSDGILGSLQEAFRVRPDAVRDVADLSALLRSGPSVAVHVRLGDRTTSKYSRIFTACGAEYYRRAVRVVEDRAGAPVDVFVFSDDPAGARELVDGLPRTTLVSDNLSGSAAQDLHLMSQCRHHVISNSSFAWWGARLGGGDDGVVVAPARWYRTSKYSVRDLYPPGWSRVDEG